MKTWIIRNIIQTEAMREFLLKSSAALMMAIIAALWVVGFWALYKLWMLF